MKLRNYFCLPLWFCSMYIYWMMTIFTAQNQHKNQFSSFQRRLKWMCLIWECNQAIPAVDRIPDIGLRIELWSAIVKYKSTIDTDLVSIPPPGPPTSMTPPWFYCSLLSLTVTLIIFWLLPSHSLFLYISDIWYFSLILSPITFFSRASPPNISLFLDSIWFNEYSTGQPVCF